MSLTLASLSSGSIGPSPIISSRISVTKSSSSCATIRRVVKRPSISRFLVRLGTARGSRDRENASARPQHSPAAPHAAGSLSDGCLGLGRREQELFQRRGDIVSGLDFLERNAA